MSDVAMSERSRVPIRLQCGSGTTAISTASSNLEGFYWRYSSSRSPTHACVLRARRQRPRSRCAAEQRDEFAPFYVGHRASSGLGPDDRYAPSAYLTKARKVLGSDLNRSESVEAPTASPMKRWTLAWCAHPKIPSGFAH